MTLDPCAVSLSEEVEKLSGMIRPSAAVRGVAFTLRMQDITQDIVVTDPLVCVSTDQPADKRRQLRRLHQGISFLKAMFLSTSATPSASAAAESAKRNRETSHRAV